MEDNDIKSKNFSPIKSKNEMSKVSILINTLPGYKMRSIRKFELT